MKWIGAGDRDALAALLADRVAGMLREAIEARGRAGLALPGGSTPGAFLTALGREDLDWEKVGVTLTDERWVPPSSERSNQRLLAETLFRGKAAAAEFVPLYSAAVEPDDGLEGIETALRQIVMPLDVAVLGMGEDGHTASLFPGADKLEQALDPEGEALVLPIRAPGADEVRITLTLAALATARKAFILIHGAEKRRILEAAAPEKENPLPIAAVAWQIEKVTVFHAD